jgi:hypothetical protein
MIFYAPEVDKTFSLGTTVVLPPVGIEPHTELRKSFEVAPDVEASGIAPQPLRDLLPGPALVSPELDARFHGLDEPIVLEWAPVKELAEDEYYEVTVDFNYKEGNPTYRYATRDLQFTVPQELYETPNCNLFNWHVTLMQQTGVGEDGQPVGTPISYDSLYRLFWWFYPEGQDPPFPVTCPNDQD